jgi:hypothetical protein
VLCGIPEVFDVTGRANTMRARNLIGYVRFSVFNIRKSVDVAVAYLDTKLSICKIEPY